MQDIQVYVLLVCAVESESVSVSSKYCSLGAVDFTYLPESLASGTPTKRFITSRASRKSDKTAEASMAYT